MKLVAGLLLLMTYTMPALTQFSRLVASTQNTIESTVVRHMNSSGTVGCSVGIIVDGEVAYLKGFGYQNREESTPASELTIYRTGSVAKTFAAIAAMQLVEQGVLDLQEDIRNYVPEYPEKSQGTVTPYRLLVHRSGIRHYEEMNEDAAIFYERDHYEYDPVAAIDVFKDGSLLFQPGTQFSYTTFGYNLLGAAVERAAQQPFLDQVRERINHKLHLPYLQAEYQRKRPYPNETAGYHIEGGIMVRTPEDIGILFKVPGGGFICSVIDLTLTVKGLMEYRLFADSATQVWMSQDHNNGNTYAGGTGFGVGIINGMHNGKHYLWHAGGQQRTATFWAYFPGTGLGVAVMSNTYASGVKSLGLQILDQLVNTTLKGNPYTHLPDTLPAPVLISPPNQTRITGSDVDLQWSSHALAHKYICEYRVESRAWYSDTVQSINHLIKNLAKNDTVRWRVKVINQYLYDGVASGWSETYSFIVGQSTGIDYLAKPQTFDVEVYPNPTTGQISISGSKDASELQTVEVIDQLGRVIAAFDQIRNNKISIDLSDFGQRTVFLRIMNGSNTTIFKPVLIY
jgi:CubicO group peptidase (beta-lactamase class C family)